MGQNVESFYRLKNKEYGREKQKKKYLIGWSHIVVLVWGEKCESYLGVWGLAVWIECISGLVNWSVYWDTEVI